MHAPLSGRGKAGLAGVIGLALVAGPVAAAPAYAAPTQITLLNINDFHGRIDSDTVRFAGTIEQLRATGGEATTALLSAGDNVGASVYASASQNDQPTIEVLNELDLMASAVGNHELDKGFTDLTDRIEPAANWQYLAANVYRADGTTPALPGDPYEIITVGGVDVAIIGAITQETPTLVSPAGVSGLVFGDPVDAVNRVVAQLDALPEADRPDVYVAEYHEGAGSSGSAQTLEQQVAASAVFNKIVNSTSPNVDVIFTGHTHKDYAYSASVAGGGTRPVVQTGEYGGNIGRVTLTVDPDTDVVSAHTQANVKRLAPNLTNVPTAQQGAANAAFNANLVSTYPRVAEVNETVNAALEQAAVTGSVKVGEVTADITTAYTNNGTTRDDRGSESTLGNLVADALVSTLSPADRGSAQIGIVNPGGLRAELLKGEDGVITYGEANAVLPFANGLFTEDLTGAQFKTVLEQQWQTAADGSIPSRSYLQLGLSKNVSYTYDPNAARGSHITSIHVDGKPIDPTKTYRIGTFSFLTAGGDNFRELAKGTNVKDSALVDRDAWISYIQANSPLSPSFARRSVAAGTLPDGIMPQGTEGSVELASLDLTSLGSPKNTSVSASFEGSKAKPVVSPVTNGAATAKFEVPFDAPANATLVLTASPSGTEVRVPITTSVAIDSKKPKIVGAPVVGNTVEAKKVGGWEPSGLKMKYQWYLDDEKVKGAESRTLKLKKKMAGDELTFRAVAKKDGYPREVRFSDAVTVVKKIDSVKPRIVGTPKVGEKLSAKTGKWTPKSVDFDYKWYRDGKLIPNATKRTYEVVKADKGSTVKVKVIATKKGYQTEKRKTVSLRIR
jgi:5'-nucleotidase